MLKKHFTLAIVIASIFISLQVTAKNNCSIKGSILDMEEGTVFIRNLTMPMLDTIRFTKSSFIYNCELKEPTPFILTDDANHYQLFFVEPNSTVNIKLKRKEMQVTFLDGSKSQDIFRKLINANEPSAAISR